MNQVLADKASHKKFGWRTVIGGVAALMVGAAGVLVMLPAVSPAAGAQVADLIRGMVGPRPVAALESGSFAVQDAVYQFIAAHNGGQKMISLAQNHAGGAMKQADTTAAGEVITAQPQIGWQPYGPRVNGSPVMAQALLSLDPQRPYAGIAVVRVDLSALKLHMLPGFLEPSHTSAVVKAIPHLGLMPAVDQAHLVAAFNGGFKAVNGQYGMSVNGVSLLPPQVGLATLGIYKDGHVAIGIWGQDLTNTPDLVAYRQNCPPVIHNGQVSPQVYVDNRAMWGNTIGNAEVTWRTGVGLSQDGRYLIYAVGNGTTVETLARAMLQAGAYNAMQLDINRHYAHFVTYQPSSATGGGLKAVQLLTQMESDPTLYLVPHSRDYFYLTTQ
jgi:hypothetical protein